MYTPADLIEIYPHKKYQLANINRSRESILDKNLNLVYGRTDSTSRKLLRIKVTPDLHLTYSKNGGNLGLVLKMKQNIDCLSILLTKHVKYTYLYLFKFYLYSIVALKAN